jgi:hypothetical protein
LWIGYRYGYGIDVDSLLATPADKPSECATAAVLIDAVWSGNFERGEIVSPVGCIASKDVGLNLATPDARHRRPLKFFYPIEV